MREPMQTGGRSLMRSAGVVGILTAASRGLGLVRDILMALVFGTSVYMSAFVVAFRIPNLFRRVFGEGALSAAFVPVFVETLESEGRDRALLLARRTLTWLGLVLGGVVLLTELALLAAWWRPPTGERLRLTLSLLQILFPYMAWICLASLSAAILQAFRRYALPAAVPCLLNVIWIAAVLIVWRSDLPPLGGIRGVAWAVLLGGILQWGVQWRPLRKLGLVWRPAAPRHDERLALVLRRMTPAAMAMAVTQFNVMLDGLLALWVGPWAPAALFYSERMVYFPLGIIATALGTVLLPAFSTQAARHNRTEMVRLLRYSMHNSLFVLLPAAVGLAVLAPPIIAMLFERRAFSAESTLLTARALRFYAPGLLVFGLSKIFVPAFYALKDMRTPLRLGLQSVALNLVLNVLFVMTWPDGFKHAGLAGATVLSGGYYTIRLGWLLHRRMAFVEIRPLVSALGRDFLACLPMALAAWPIQRFLAGTAGRWLPLGLARPAGTLGALLASVFLYGAAAWLLGSPECREFRRLLPLRR